MSGTADSQGVARITDIVTPTRARSLTDEGLRRILGELSPYTALSGDLRSSGCEPRTPGETCARETPVERAIDTGLIGRARAASARMVRAAPHGRLLVWLASSGGLTSTCEGMALALALEQGPASLRRTYEASRLAAHRADHARDLARQRAQVGRRAPTAEALALGGREVETAIVAADSARAREGQAHRALVGWGLPRITAACVAWEEAGDVPDPPVRRVPAGGEG